MNEIKSFRYYGSKEKIIKKLLPYFPDHLTYVSVFGGSATDICGKPRSRNEVYNDLDGRLTTFFRVVQHPTKFEQLQDRVSLLPLGRDLHEEHSRVLIEGHEDDVRVAVAVYANAEISYAGLLPVGNSPRSIGLERLQPVPGRWRLAESRLRHLAKRFRLVWIENRPWEDVLDQHEDVSTFFYLDPPYLHDTRKSSGAYKHEMSEADHARLLNRLRGVNAKVMVSGYPSKLYDDMLACWRQVVFTVVSMVSEKRTLRSEAVWMNYDEAGRLL